MGNSNPTPVLNAAGETPTSIFEFEVEDSFGKTISLSTYKGKKAFLIVNVASQCGLTGQNYTELQQLYAKYKDEGFEVLAFPCNNFGSQEPGSNEEVCTFAGKRGATFPILGKLQCEAGNDTHPLYLYLRGALSGGILGQSIKWNFTKFLINAEGVPVKRFGPTQSPMSFEKEVKALLDETK